MSIDSVGTLTNVKFTKNHNAYQASNAGKKVGTAVGTGVAAAKTVSLLFDKEFKEVLNLSWKNIATYPFTKFEKFVAKHPNIFKAGTVAIGAAIAFALYAGVGKLIGHCVDKFVERKRAKEADEKVEQKAREIELTKKLDVLL